MEQALQGNIGRFTLPEIFQLIANGGKTGTLGIQKDDDIIMIYFKKGKIIYAYGPRESLHLGQLLKDKRRITANQLDDAVNTQANEASSKRLGRILIEKGYIDRADLEKAIKEQVEELIYSLLSWETGTFKFYENQYPTQEEITVNVSVENAILEACRRMDELNRIKGALPNFNSILTIASAPAERDSNISLKSEEWNLLSLVSGRRSISEIVEKSRLPRIDALRKLAGLKLAGLIAVVEKKEEEANRLEGMVNRVAGLLQEYLEHKTRSRTEAKTTLQSLEESTESRLSESQMTTKSTGEDD